MGINAECRLDIRVSQPLGDNLDVYALSEKLGGVGMPQVVEAQVGQALSFQEVTESVREPVRRPWTAIFQTHDKVVFCLVGGAKEKTAFDLFAAMPD